jgi:hypothetical protein
VVGWRHESNRVSGPNAEQYLTAIAFLIPSQKFIPPVCEILFVTHNSLHQR